MKTLIIILQNLPTILTCVKELVYAIKQQKNEQKFEPPTS